MNYTERALGWTSRFQGWLGAAVVCGVVALAWSGYRAATEWQGSSALLVERRARDLADLLTTALTRDMRGLQASVLSGPGWTARSFEPPYDIRDVVATAFARYPYPDFFFGWREAPGVAAVFFTRADRPPAWAAGRARASRYPVEFGSNSSLERALRSRIQVDVAAQRLYSVFDITVDGVLWQVVARLVYEESTREHLATVFGFVVDLNWVRQHYYSGLAQQASRIGQASSGLEYVIVDDRGGRVVGPDRVSRPETTITRYFTAVFVDPSLIELDPPPDLGRSRWTIRVSAATDPTLELAARGARRTVFTVAVAALIAGLGLVITVRAAKANVRIAMMRSDFVSTVTHELKTPLSTIRMIAETLARGRLESPDDVQNYADLLVQEERRLGRLIENLLAFARVTDEAEVYAFEPQAPAELVAEAMRGFRRQLADSGFEVTVNVDATLPKVRGDRTALVFALDNLIDNAIRYSGAAGRVVVSARGARGAVAFTVADQGVGISPDDLERVQRRFVRGRSPGTHGSGLGLAIVKRIAADHGGTFRIESTVGVGTTVTLTVPALGH